MFLFNRSVILGIGLLFLVACGGGGGSPADPPATEAVWNQSNWDEKNWQ